MGGEELIYPESAQMHSLFCIQRFINLLYSHQYDGTVIHKSCLQCLQNRRKQNKTLQEKCMET